MAGDRGRSDCADGWPDVLFALRELTGETLSRHGVRRALDSVFWVGFAGVSSMEPCFENHRDYAAALEAELAVARAERAAALAELGVAKAKEADDQAIILRQKVYIGKPQRELRGQKSERPARLIAQLELMLEDAEATATEDELAAEMAVAAAAAIAVTGFTRKRPVKKPFPEHLPRECVVVPGPVACSCFGGERLRKLGEDIAETM